VVIQNTTPVLAAATGGYQERSPMAALDSHFRCVWSNSLAHDQSGALAVVPDGCIDLTWVNGDLVIAGPDTSVAVSPIARGGTVVGARFRPGAASNWLGFPMSEIVGTRVPLSEFWGARARTIAASIGDASSTAERMQILEAALGELACDIEAPAPDMGFVFNALKSDSGGRGLSVILERLDVSSRTLRRRCHAAFGYGPKTLERILRFQRFLRVAGAEAGDTLAGLAFEAGYADQAHLTREVRSLSGFSPATIMSQLQPRDM
jgi:AraC-like DNA-binding protein